MLFPHSSCPHHAQWLVTVGQQVSGVVLWPNTQTCSHARTPTHTHAYVHVHTQVRSAPESASCVLLLKAAHCVSYPPPTLSCDNAFKGLCHRWGSCDFGNWHETDILTYRYLSLNTYIYMHTNTLTTGLRRTPWCSGSPWWWEDPRGSALGGQGAWRTSPSWGTPPYSRIAGTCSLHPDAHTQRQAKVSPVFALLCSWRTWYGEQSTS